MAQPGGVPTARRDSRRDAQVFFFEKIVPDNGVHVPQGSVVLCGEDEAFRSAVEPVAHGGGESLLFIGVVLASLCTVVTEEVDEAHVARRVRMTQEMRRFVQCREIFVLPDHAKREALFLRLMLRDFGGGGFCGKKFIVDIELDNVALLQARVGFGVLAVDADAFVAEAFVQQGLRHPARDVFNKT